MSDTKYFCTKCKQEVDPVRIYKSYYSIYYDPEFDEYTEEAPDWSECCNDRIKTWFTDCEDRPDGY